MFNDEGFCKNIGCHLKKDCFNFQVFFQKNKPCSELINKSSCKSF